MRLLGIIISSLLVCLCFSISTLANELNNENSGLGIKFITGVDYSSGYYGMQKPTDMLYIPLIFKYNHQNWDYRLTFSYLKISGPGGVIPTGGGGMMPVNDNHGSDPSVTETTRVTRPDPMNQGNNMQVNMSSDYNAISTEGVGDVLFKANYVLDVPLKLPFFLEIGTEIKLPVADAEKELGTGKADISFYFELADNFDLYYPFVNLAYKFMGDPDGVNFNNIFIGSIGMDYAAFPQLHGGLIYDYQQKIIADSYDVSELTLYLNWIVTADFSINSYVVKGFSNGSPDWTSGMQLSFTF